MFHECELPHGPAIGLTTGGGRITLVREGVWRHLRHVSVRSAYIVNPLLRATVTNILDQRNPCPSAKTAP